MNIQKLKSWFKKKWAQAKENATSFAWLFSALAVGAAFVGADGWADLAKKKFWWSVWGGVFIVSIVIVVIAVAYAAATEKRRY